MPFHWRGLDITLCRLGLGYELWCDADSALIVWDRLMAAGRSFALLPAGQAALDVLEGESGVLRPGRDFTPSRDGFGVFPRPQDLGLCSLVDRAHIFNGKAGFLAAGRDTVLSGLLFSAAPATAVLTHLGVPIGKREATGSPMCRGGHIGPPCSGTGLHSHGKEAVVDTVGTFIQ